jgi:hypothetical protein
VSGGILLYFNKVKEIHIIAVAALLGWVLNNYM